MIRADFRFYPIHGDFKRPCDSDDFIIYIICGKIISQVVNIWLIFCLFSSPKKTELMVLPDADRILLKNDLALLLEEQ
jgi:hypothetical protein